MILAQVACVTVVPQLEAYGNSSVCLVASQVQPVSVSS